MDEILKDEPLRGKDPPTRVQEPVLLNVYGALELMPRNEFRRYENPIPPRCLAPIDFLKIPAQPSQEDQHAIHSVQENANPLLLAKC